VAAHVKATRRGPLCCVACFAAACVCCCRLRLLLFAAAVQRCWRVLGACCRVHWVASSVRVPWVLLMPRDDTNRGGAVALLATTPSVGAHQAALSMRPRCDTATGGGAGHRKASLSAAGLHLPARPSASLRHRGTDKLLLLTRTLPVARPLVSRMLCMALRALPRNVLLVTWGHTSGVHTPLEQAPGQESRPRHHRTAWWCTQATCST
jgi:hypothetical protein